MIFLSTFTPQNRFYSKTMLYGSPSGGSERISSEKRMSNSINQDAFNSLPPSKSKPPKTPNVSKERSPAHLALPGTGPPVPSLSLMTKTSPRVLEKSKGVALGSPPKAKTEKFLSLRGNMFMYYFMGEDSVELFEIDPMSPVSPKDWVLSAITQKKSNRVEVIYLDILDGKERGLLRLIRVKYVKFLD